MNTVPTVAKVLLAVGLAGAGGLLIGVPLIGMRSEVRYERRRVRTIYSARHRRIFWAWAMAFPIIIFVGGILGVVTHAGRDWFTSELIGVGFAAAIVIPATVIVQVYLGRQTKAARDSSGTS